MQLDQGPGHPSGCSFRDAINTEEEEEEEVFVFMDTIEGPEIIMRGQQQRAPDSDLDTPTCRRHFLTSLAPAWGW